MDSSAEDMVMFGAAKCVVDIASRKGYSIGCAESLTGGMISSAIVSVPGASQVFKGGIVSYAYSAKENILGVDHALLQSRGAVNAECAKAMAAGAVSVLGVDFAVSATGIAGPAGGGAEGPVGTVFLGACTPAGTYAAKFLFRGSREDIRRSAAMSAIELLASYMESFEDNPA